MITAVVQMKIDITRPEDNLAAGLSHIREACDSGAKIIVMPEMWITGLHPDIVNSPFVEKTPDIIEKICSIAREYSVIINAGSFAFRDGAGCGPDRRVFNRAYIIDGAGRVCGTYDKIQVFTKNNEDAYTRPGSSVSVIDAGGIKIAPFICFDIRFPELFRIAAMNGAELITVSSQFPASRINHWNAMMPARAVENQCYVLASNICGHDGLLALGGNSMAVSHDGEVLNNCLADEGIGFAGIDLELARSYRSKFPFISEAALADRLSPLITGVRRSDG